jgi:catechol-2,3-dioxygenase
MRLMRCRKQLLNLDIMPDSPYTIPDQTRIGHVHLKVADLDRAVALQRLADAKYPITGASDHGVSEAIYLNDPDQNGVELYWDRPQDQLPRKSDGSIEMYTHPLDLEGLLSELK